MSAELQPKRILLVHHDTDTADQQVDSLRREGYVVEQCSGPESYACPVMRGDSCPAVERADVLVYDVWATGESDGGKHLIEGLREMYPHIPVVLTAPGMELDWVETQGPHAVVPLVGMATGKRLDAAITEALLAQKLNNSRRQNVQIQNK